jgi:hypothetical protein
MALMHLLDFGSGYDALLLLGKNKRDAKWVALGGRLAPPKCRRLPVLGS